jgi:hypothetical protein
MFNLNGMLKTGIILIIIAFVVLLVGGFAQQGIGNTLQNTTVASNFTVAPNSYHSYLLHLSNYSYLILFAKFSSPLNVYFVNSSAFNAWSSSNSIGKRNGLNSMLSYENNGLFIAYKDQLLATVPQGLSNSTNVTAIYASNTALYSPGTYYLIADNTNGSLSSQTSVSGTIAYLPPISNQTIASGPYSQIKNQIYQSLAIGLLFYVLLFAGIIIAIYGLFRKPKTAVVVSSTDKNGAPSKEEIDRLYKGIGKKPVKPKSGKAKKQR